MEIVTIHLTVDEVPDWRLSPPLMRAGVREGDPPLVGILAAAWLADGRIVVVDGIAKWLHLYGTDGSHIHSFGGPGDGPGEFRRIGPVSIGPDDRIFANDMRDGAGGSLQEYDPESGFVATVDLAGRDEVRRTWGTPDGYIQSYGDRGTPRHAGRDIQIWASTQVLQSYSGVGSHLSELQFEGTYSAITPQGDVLLPFAPRPFVHLGADALLYGSGQAGEVREADRVLALRRIIRWPSLEIPLDQAQVEGGEADVALVRNG